MLERTSSKLQTCLASAARSRERAAVATDGDVRAFFVGMEASWTRLAASIAFSQRVDLFLQNVASRTGWDRCIRCGEPVHLKLAELSDDAPSYALACTACGFAQMHSLHPTVAADDLMGAATPS